MRAAVLQGLLDEPSTRSTSTPKASASSKQKQLTFRIFFPLPPFEGSIRFNALKAGVTYNFMVRPEKPPGCRTCWVHMDVCGKGSHHA